jgi:uridylate kinase
VVAPFSRRAAIALQNKGVANFTCGTGNPLFTTDTAAALEALEIEQRYLVRLRR